MITLEDDTANKYLDTGTIKEVEKVIRKGISDKFGKNSLEKISFEQPRFNEDGWSFLIRANIKSREKCQTKEEMREFVEKFAPIRRKISSEVKEIIQEHYTTALPILLIGQEEG